MKKFLKRNTIISLFALISILISVSYALTYNMPDYFGIESWYSLLNNISISYIAAFVFYILQVYKPECEKSRKAQMILAPLFDDLVAYMEKVIACCRKYVSVDETGGIAIAWQNNQEKIIYFVPVTEGKNGGHQVAIKKSIDDLKKLDDVFRQKIREIKDRIDFRDCDTDVLNALSQLEAADFFKKTVIPALMFEGTFVKILDFQTKVDEFEIKKDNLKKLCGINIRYDVRNAELMEIAACEAIYGRNALQVGTAEEFTMIAYTEYLKQRLRPLVGDEDQVNKLTEEILRKTNLKKANRNN